ncbi:BT1 family-domain-containing protein [Obelidium mucronatum]|nr:BT1 family-domain-containing protein [Obelidium mucronatum]
MFATLYRLIVNPVKDLRDFWDNSVKEFSLTFMLIIGLTYFLQGFRGYAFGDGIIWFFSDVFELDPGPTQLYMSTIFITWNIKMIYGLVFDNFPLFGRKDIPYMVLSGIISFIGFMALGVPALTPTPDVTTFWFFLALMGLAMSDVIADAMVVRQAREAGESGGANLQAYCWVLSSIGGIIGRPIAGLINGKDGQGSRVLLGIVYSTSSVLGCIVTLMHKEQVLFQSVFGNRLVWLPMSWIILNQAIVPDRISIRLGDIFAIGGLVLYTKYFKKTQFSLIFFWTQVCVAIFAMADVVLVNRWNVALGISDEFFLIGSQTVINTLYSFQAMPFFVLAAQLCPKDIEATFYACMMSIGNIGGNIGTMYGGYLLQALHIVKSTPTLHHLYHDTGAAFNATANATLLPNGTIIPSNSSSSPQEFPNNTTTNTEEYDFSNLPLFLWIRVASMAASAFFVFAMVPNKPEEGGEKRKRVKEEEEEEEVMNLVQKETDESSSTSLDVVDGGSPHKRSPSKRRAGSAKRDFGGGECCLDD